MCIKINQKYKGKKKLGRTSRRWDENNTSFPEKSSKPSLSLLMFEVVHIYLCIIIIIIIIMIVKAIVVFLMGFDIIHIHQYVKLSVVASNIGIVIVCYLLTYKRKLTYFVVHLLTKFYIPSSSGS